LVRKDIIEKDHSLDKIILTRNLADSKAAKE